MTTSLRTQIRHCPACGLTTAASFREIQDHYSLEIFRLALCPSCGTAFLSDPPTRESIARYYDNPLGQMMHQTPGGLFNRLRSMLLHKEIGRLTHGIPPGELILDYGTGDGAIADTLQRHGYSVLALDMFPPSRWKYPAIPYRQVDLNGGSLAMKDLQFEGRTPSGVILRHVLEHLFDPVEVLGQFARSRIQRVLVVVPNLDSPWRTRLGDAWCFWDPPRHLTHFTPGSLEVLAARAGYKKNSLETYGIDEWISSAFRYFMLRRKQEQSQLSLPMRALSPKSPLAAISSAANAFIGNCVIRCLLELQDIQEPHSR